MLKKTRQAVSIKAVQRNSRIDFNEEGGEGDWRNCFQGGGG